MSRLKKDNKDILSECNDKKLTLPEKTKVLTRYTTRKSNKRATNDSDESRQLNSKLKPNPHPVSSSTMVRKGCDPLQKETTDGPNNKDATLPIPSDQKCEVEANQNSNKKGKMYRYEVDLTAMAKLKTVNAVDFKNYVSARFKDNGKVNNLARNVTVEHDGWLVIVQSKIFFKKSVLKYHSKKFLKMKKLRDFVKVVGKGKLSYQFAYYQPQ